MTGDMSQQMTTRIEIPEEWLVDLGPVRAHRISRNYHEHVGAIIAAGGRVVELEGDLARWTRVVAAEGPAEVVRPFTTWLMTELTATTPEEA